MDLNSDGKEQTLCVDSVVDGSNYNFQRDTSGFAEGSHYYPACALPDPLTLHPSEQRKSRCSCCTCCRTPAKAGDEPLGGCSESSTNESKVSRDHPRKWKYFPGNNHFYCSGRIMTAPSIRYCTLSLVLILLTFGLFIAFDAPFLMKRLTIAIPIVSSMLFVLVIVNMLRTSCSDPGILPRASAAEVEDMERSYGTTAATYRPPPRTKDIIVNGQSVKSKYCFTCKMFRPPRASHCSICDNCVERFDHHCPFLGNCVGRRNYRSFYFFVVSLSLLAVLILSCSVTHLALLAKDRGNFLDALRESPTSAAVILISFFGMWTVIGLAGFHTYLIAVEQTTNEDIKGIFGRPNSKNPYSRGSTYGNCCYILCGPNPPSLLDPRGYVTPDFLDSLQLPRSTQETVTQQPPNRAQAAPVFNYSYAGPQTTSGSTPSAVDVSHLTATPQPTFTEIILPPASNPPSRANGTVPEPPKAGTFPESKRLAVGGLKEMSYGNGSANRVPAGSNEAPRSQNQTRNFTESMSMVRLPTTTSSPRNRNSGPPPLAPTAQRKVNNNKSESINPSNGILRNSASSLERLTMINSPLHLDPVM